MSRCRARNGPRPGRDRGSGATDGDRGASAPEADRGSGSLLALGVGLAMVTLLAVALPLYMGLAVRGAVAAAADASALAAADVASGSIPGFPCETAEEVAAANGAAVESCDVDGLVVTVVATRQWAGVTARSAATAGPAGSGLD